MHAEYENDSLFAHTATLSKVWLIVSCVCTFSVQWTFGPAHSEL